MKKSIYVCGLFMALLMGTSTMVSCNKEDDVVISNGTSGGSEGGQENLKPTKETVTWNFQVQDMQLAQEMGLKMAYYDGDGNIKTADVNALNNGKFSVKVVADATKGVKMGFVAVWFLNKPAAEYTADSYNFINTITPTIVRTFPNGDRTVQIGVAPYAQTGIFEKTQTGSSLQNRINKGINYVSTFFGYSYSDSNTSSISDKELLKALGVEKK